MATTIDLDKAQKAYDFLAENPNGHQALEKLRGAFDALQTEIQPNLNRGEFLYVLRSLVDSLHVNEVPTEPDEVEGYAFGNIQGLVFQGQPGAVGLSNFSQRFAGINRITPSGFVIRPDI